jgi:hypothetical protein
VIERITQDVIESFWKMGMLPKKSSIRIGDYRGNDKYEVTAIGMEIPESLMPEETPESLQAMMDGFWLRDSNIGIEFPWVASK